MLNVILGVEQDDHPTVLCDPLHVSRGIII